MINKHPGTQPLLAFCFLTPSHSTQHLSCFHHPPAVVWSLLTSMGITECDSLPYPALNLTGVICDPSRFTSCFLPSLSLTVRTHRIICSLWLLCSFLSVICSAGSGHLIVPDWGLFRKVRLWMSVHGATCVHVHGLLSTYVCTWMSEQLL